MATQYWAEGVWEQKKTWTTQIHEVQMWKHVRGPAGAVMCETRDLGIKWSYWHTLVFSDETKIDLGFVCPRDVKKMLVQRARPVFWKKWAAKHEELKEGAWVEPAPALLRKKAKGVWTWKHRNVARKIFLEGGWTQKRLFDIGCQSMSSLPDGGRHRLYHCPEWHAIRRDIPESFRKWEHKARTSKKEWKWQRGIVAHSLSDGQWNGGHYSVTKWESEKHRS